MDRECASCRQCGDILTLVNPNPLRMPTVPNSVEPVELHILPLGEKGVEFFQFGCEFFLLEHLAIKQCLVVGRNVMVALRCIPHEFHSQSLVTPAVEIAPI